MRVLFSSMRMTGHIPDVIVRESLEFAAAVLAAEYDIPIASVATTNGHTEAVAMQAPWRQWTSCVGRPDLTQMMGRVRARRRPSRRSPLRWMVMSSRWTHWRRSVCGQ